MISGEEFDRPDRLRAARLGLGQAPLRLAAETNLRDILTTLEAERPALLSSIRSRRCGQTTWTAPPARSPRSAPPPTSSTTFAKRRGVAVVLVGHVTKDGQIAGPRIIEHMVDTVLYFEGERGHQFRILRAVKNRFGPADEIGVFEMTGSGLAEVANPRRSFSERDSATSGSAVFAGVEGTRPLLVEIQALVVLRPGQRPPHRHRLGRRPPRHGARRPRVRAAASASARRTSISTSLGGLRISEPAADLAVAAALVSAREGIPLPRDAVFFGEISLSGRAPPGAAGRGAPARGR